MLLLSTVQLIAALLLASSWAGAQTPASPVREQAVFVNDQQSLSPGYAIGDIAIGDPKVADFKVMAGRREVLIIGKGVGSTRLTLWDQKKVKRDEILITVTTRQGQDLERELRDMLKDFPSVEVRPFAGGLAVTGAVSSKDDLAAIDKIAAAARVRNLVRYVPPVVAPPPGGVGTIIASPSVPGGTPIPVAPGAVVEIEYEIELLEASVRFRSGSYATGVEPSGRSLYKGIIRAPIGAEREVFIGGNAVTTAKSGSGDSKKGGSAGPSQAAKPVQTGIKLTVTPAAPDARGKFKTALLVETNLPFSGETYDPAVWRKARWEFTAGSREPFGITGSDLLATPDAFGNQLSAIGSATRAASVVRRIPGVSLVPGAEYMPVFGSLFGSKAYKQKTTQLLVILRPRAIVP